MSFDEIIETAKIKKEKRDRLDKILHQRQLCGEIISGMLYYGFKLTMTEQVFVMKCNRSMKPISNWNLSVLTKLDERRWNEQSIK